MSKLSLLEKDPLKKYSPYIQLTRMKHPIGIWLLLLPCYWGLALNAQELPLKWWFLFFIGAFFMRGAGCTLNDLADQKFDRLVERTKNRPITSGLITSQQVLIFFALQCMAAFLIFLMLPFASQLWALAGLVLLIIYPFSKRFFPYPQLVLGFAFNIGVFVAWHITNKDFSPAIFLLYGAGIAWTLAYDTIYAFQDAVDDKKIGLNSTALQFSGAPHLFIGACYGVFLSLLLIFGYKTEQSILFFLICVLTFGLSYYIVYTLNPSDRSNCHTRFRWNQWIGLSVFISLLAGSLH